MAYAPDADQRELKALVRRFCADKSTVADVRRAMNTDEGFDASVWAQMGKELGLQALHIPEAFGGMGYTYVELGLVLEEMGRALLCVPFFSSVVLGAGAVLAAGTDEQRSALLPGIAAGDVRAALALAEDDDPWLPGSIRTEAHPDGDSVVLHGRKNDVVDGHTAHQVVVVARDPGTAGTAGIGLFLVDATNSSAAERMTRRSVPTFDQTRKLAVVDLDGTPAIRLGNGASGWAEVEQTLQQAAVCLAAEQVGGAAACLDMAVGYAKIRNQFGRPVGSFQAVKHRCADMLLGVESARSAAFQGLAAARAGEDLTAPACIALSECSTAFSAAASDNIRVHGGVGFTWEHDAHLYLKRAKSSEALLGGVSLHRERLATRIGL